MKKQSKKTKYFWILGIVAALILGTIMGSYIFPQTIYKNQPNVCDSTIPIGYINMQTPSYMGKFTYSSSVVGRNYQDASYDAFQKTNQNYNYCFITSFYSDTREVNYQCYK